MRKQINKMMKVAMIGPSGSGKTMFLGGFSDAFISSGVRGTNHAVITVTGSGNDGTIRGNQDLGALNAMRVTQRMEKYKQERLMPVQKSDGTIGKAAAGTVEMTNFFFNFDVSSANGDEWTQVLKLTDYRGGLLSLDYIPDNETEEAECEALMVNLSDSDVIFILIDGIKIAQYRNNPRLMKIKTGADRINTIMNGLMRDPKKGVVVNVLVTKVDSDAIPSDLKADNYKKLCELAVNAIDLVNMKSVSMENNYQWIFSVVPVTAIGENNSITNYVDRVDEYFCAIKNGASIQQNNVDAAIIHSILAANSSRVAALNKEINGYDTRIRLETSKMGLFNRAQHKAFLEENYRKKDEARTECDKYDSMSNCIYQNYGNLINSVRGFRSVC